MYSTCMLSAKHGFAQSLDCAVQSLDSPFGQAIHGLCYICTILELHNLNTGGGYVTFSRRRLVARKHSRRRLVAGTFSRLNEF